VTDVAYSTDTCWSSVITQSTATARRSQSQWHLHCTTLAARVGYNRFESIRYG